MSASFFRVGIIAAFSLALLSGCGIELETGYKPRPLNATETQRRAFYASPFSPQKTAADQERQQSHNSPLSAQP